VTSPLVDERGGCLSLLPSSPTLSLPSPHRTLLPHTLLLTYSFNPVHSFEVYERSKGDGPKELSVRVSLSEGAHSAVLDASLDAKHALQVQPRRALTGEPPPSRPSSVRSLAEKLTPLFAYPSTRLHQPRQRHRDPFSSQHQSRSQADQEVHHQDRGTAPHRG
jgi:hypothetical protein